MERVFNWTPWESASRLPPGDKTFSRFQKGLFTFVFLKPREPFPNTNKKERVFNWTPDSPPGDKAFVGFKTGRSSGVFLKVK